MSTELRQLQQLLAWLMARPGERAPVAAKLGLSAEQVAAMRWAAWVPGKAPGASGHLAIGFADSDVSLPQLLRHPVNGSRLPLRVVRSGRGRLQCVSLSAENVAHSSGTGTLNSLLRDRQSGQLYALTAGHVLAGHPQVQINDRVALQTLSGLSISASGTLCNWKPNFHVGSADTPIDAALAALGFDQAETLLDSGLELPQGSAAIEVQAALSLRTRNSALRATARGYISSWLDLDDGGDTQDYRLVSGLAYDVDGGSAAGDSGAPLWNTENRLVAMHAGEGPGEGVGNAIAVPIARVLEWSNADVIVQGESLHKQLLPQEVPPIAVPQRANDASQAPVGQGPAEGSSAKDVDVLARTIWGEAHREPDAEAGMAAVTNVVINRNRRQTFWGRTIEEVCRKPYQFACWNADSPTRSALLGVLTADPEFATASRVARDALEHRLPDNTSGATHYYSRWLAVPPRWSRGHSPCATVGNLLFFNDID